MTEHESPSRRSNDNADSTGAGTLLLPVVLLVLTVLAMAAFQTTQMFLEQRNLEAARAGQQQPLEQATRLQRQLETIARGTARLAEAGNANAQQVVDGLRRRGITINLDAPTAQ